MKALYTCDHCNYSTTDLEKMKQHEAAHKDAEILANRINGLIVEYNSKHDDAFCIAKYTPNLANKKPKPKAEPEKPAKKPAENLHSNSASVIAVAPHPLSTFVDDCIKALDVTLKTFEGGV